MPSAALLRFLKGSSATLWRFSKTPSATLWRFSKTPSTAALEIFKSVFSDFLNSQRQPRCFVLSLETPTYDYILKSQRALTARLDWTTQQPRTRKTARKTVV